MKKLHSLDDLISKKAIEFADQIKAAAAMADKEEEIRIASERQLAFIERETDVKLEGKHEFTVASGRVDSVYDRVIIEYKNPKSPADRIGPNVDSPGSKKVVKQIKDRFYDMRAEHGQPLNTLFGVGLDGNRFIFVRFRDDKWQVQEPVEVNRYSAERFLWALFNLGTKGKPFSPEYLSGDFGSEAKLAQEGIHALYDAIVSTDNPKATTFFSQWRILFGEVCGYDVDHPSDKIKELAEFYGVAVKRLKPAELLFAVHTYYALFMKLLASEIVAFFHKLSTPLQKMMQAGTSNKLKREMEDLEAGSIFRHLNVTNFLEGDLFAWYTAVWSEPIEKLVRDMVARLDNYNPGTLSEEPASSRDLLKKLYHELFPKTVRHDLGEYYTPDWLAEHVLNELNYEGDPDKRILDPACGSGTFLVMAINRIRKWYDANREKCRFGEDDLCRKTLSNVIGFDLNPLAVMAARTNYLIAIRDLIGYVDKVEIPIYLCDSILTPSTYGGLFAGTTTAAKELKTAAAMFLVPTEIATSRDDVAKYAEQLEFCVKNGYSPREFVERCHDEGLPVTAENLHADLYTELVKLDKANKNGVWARIIKNAFAPLFAGRFDYVAGNPPWVFWNNLPSEYRDVVRELMANTYHITAKRASTMKRLGAAGKDLSMLFFYVALDKYLRRGGSWVMSSRKPFSNLPPETSFASSDCQKGKASGQSELRTGYKFSHFGQRLATRQQLS
jgi:SAM-dependent methyltransferase